MTQPMRAFTVAEVRDAVKEWFMEEGYCEGTWHAAGGAARVLNVSLHYGYDPFARREVERFTGQAERALNKLAADGVIQKAPAGTPAYGTTGRYARYWTHAKADEAAAAARERRLARDVADARWQAVRDTLARLGYTAEGKGATLTMDIANWEHVAFDLDAFERSTH